MRETLGQNVTLLLPAAAYKQLDGARRGDEALFGVRKSRTWSIWGRGRIAGEAVMVDSPIESDDGSQTACALPLEDVEVYETERSEFDFGLPAESWPSTGRRYATRVGSFDEGVAGSLVKSTVPRGLFSSSQREEAGVPGEVNALGSYIVELNVAHRGGLPAAAAAFLALYDRVIAAHAKPDERWDPVSIAKSYYRCEMSVVEWRKLITEDVARAAEAAKADGDGQPGEYLSIYKLWPDFKVRRLVDRSTSTIKADAARRTFDATGDGIVWAVLDSGIDARHPHFGAPGNSHTLLSKEVIDLHRSFVHKIVVTPNGVRKDEGPIPSPAEPGLAPETQKLRIEQHRDAAFDDREGHGTHVAGIIAGAAPVSPAIVGGQAPALQVFERRATLNDDGSSGPDYAIRATDAARLHGVAPNCKLVSLKVLDDRGDGRASDVIMALEYIRESLNDNPRLMRIHGVNMSLGYEFDPDMYACGQSPLCVVVNRLVQSGVVVVAAAGNTGFGTIAARVRSSAQAGLSNTINDPGNAASAITVGSTHRDSPHTYGVSFFSSKGPTGDGTLKPDLVAPGERITSCASGAKLTKALAGSVPAMNRDPNAAYYVDDSGTSMAAPHVSGAIAAFLSIRREFIGKSLEVKEIFLESATSLGRERYFEGRGLIDLMRAIQSV